MTPDDLLDRLRHAAADVSAGHDILVPYAFGQLDRQVATSRNCQVDRAMERHVPHRAENQAAVSSGEIQA
jgi:hypothetical protein